MQWRDSAMQHVIDAVVEARLFDGCNVGGLFNHTYQPLVARWVRAVSAWIDIGDVVADGAEVKLFFEIADRRGKGLGVFSAGAQDVKGHSLGALAAYAGEFLEFIDELSHRLGKLGHAGLYKPGIPMPPSKPPTVL